MDRNISPVNTKGQDSGYPENEEEEVKKRIVIAMVTGLIIASLAGCGTQADATDQEVSENSAVESGAETEETATDEITSTEVIGDDTEENGEFVGAEDDSIVLYAEIAEYGKYMPLTEESFEADINTFTAYEDIPIYNVNGVEVGYIKNGSTITTTESGTEIYWARFENPIKEADYDYLYLTRDYIKEAQTVSSMPSADDIKKLIIEDMNSRDEAERPTILDTPDSDMEVYECRIARESDSTILDYKMRQALDNDTFYVGGYMTYCVECVEDDNFVDCTIYYKDSYEEWLEQQNQ